MLLGCSVVGFKDGTAEGDLYGSFDGAFLNGDRVGDGRKVDAACLFEKCASIRASNDAAKELVGNEQ